MPNQQHQLKASKPFYTCTQEKCIFKVDNNILVLTAWKRRPKGRQLPRSRPDKCTTKKRSLPLTANWIVRTDMQTKVHAKQAIHTILLH